MKVLTLDFLTGNQETEEDERLELNGRRLGALRVWMMWYVPPRLYQEL